MFRITLITMAIVVAVIPAEATVINIPADYSTIQQGIDASSTDDTVLVQPGTYTENINFNGHNITLGSLFLTTGNENYIEQTIIDGDSAGSVVTFMNSETNNTILTGFTISGGYAEFGAGIYCAGASPTVSHNLITGNEAYQLEQGEGGGVVAVYSNMILINNVITRNYAEGALGGFGGGLSCGYSNMVIAGNVIKGNTAGWGGGGVYCYSSSPGFYRNMITNNRGIFWGGGMYLEEANPVVMNNTFSHNIARWQDGGAMYIINNSNPIITNTIFYADSALEEGDEIYIEYGTPVLMYCDIEGGWQGTGNIDVDPYFRSPADSNFHLMSTECGDQYDSPCIDVGDPLVTDLTLDCSQGLGSALSDLGGYGGGDSVTSGITDDLIRVPENFVLMRNYPNPFNASTTIHFVLTNSQNVKLSVYDVLGRELETLVDEYRQAGVYNIPFDGSNLSSGIYFYKIETGDLSQVKKMQLLK